MARRELGDFVTDPRVVDWNEPDETLSEFIWRKSEAAVQAARVRAIETFFASLLPKMPFLWLPNPRTR